MAGRLFRPWEHGVLSTISISLSAQDLGCHSDSAVFEDNGSTSFKIRGVSTQLLPSRMAGSPDLGMADLSR